MAMAMAMAGYMPCNNTCCPANTWAVHCQHHHEQTCGKGCPSLTCMEEHKVCNT
jgi:hypothetical protein